MPNAKTYLSSPMDRSDGAVGNALLALRKQHGFSVSALATLAGVSVGMVSQLERNRANPSIKILEKLSAALGVPIGTFIDAPASKVINNELVRATSSTNSKPIAPAVRARAPRTSLQEGQFIRRAADRPVFKVGSALLHKELLSPFDADDVRFMYIRMPSGADSLDELLVGPGKKAGIVMEGQLNLTIGDQTFELEVGDSFQFDASQQHRIRNPHHKETVIIWFMTAVPSIHM